MLDNKYFALWPGICCKSVQPSEKENPFNVQARLVIGWEVFGWKK